MASCTNECKMIAEIDGKSAREIFLHCHTTSYVYKFHPCVHTFKDYERIQRELADELWDSVYSCASLLRTQLSQKNFLLSIGLGDIVCFNVIVDHALS